MYKSAFLGCGPRAKVHARAYDGLDEIRLQAICDMDRSRLDAFGAEFQIANRYEDLETMLKAESPDILHVVTKPDVREMPIELAAQHGVKGILVEKPLALFPSQVEKIRETADRTGIKIALNTQRPYFPQCQALREILTQGTIGEILFVRVVTKGNIASMGPHVVDLLMYLLGGEQPENVWACARGMNGYDYDHPAPANMLIRYVFPSSVVAYVEDADDCVGTPNTPGFWMHMEYNFWGTRGRAWWTQDRDWGYQADGMTEPHVARTCWTEDDLVGQREFTRAMAHWLDNDKNAHINNLDTALAGFSMIMGAMQSALTGQQVDLPAEVSDDVIKAIEEKCSS